MATLICNRYQATLLTLICLALLVAPSAAFGAGYVSRGSAQRGSAFRHGDILLAVPFLARANRRLIKQIYFANWLRDFSQLLDATSLALVPEPILRALVAVFGMLQFGYSTKEFEVTQERLGVYRPREHIDNPKGYKSDQDSDSRLRGSVRPDEYAIDSATGMKAYIAGNPIGRAAEGPGVESAAEFIQHHLVAAIACGRSASPEAYVHLGTALHTLEDFLAHSNWVELCMRTIGQRTHQSSSEDNVKLPKSNASALSRIFPFVGDAVRVKIKGGSVAPLVTGTFGALDLYQTLLGEIDDKLSAFSLPGLKARTSDGGALQKVTKILISQLSDLDAPFEKDVTSIYKMASKSAPMEWGKLQEAPDMLWTSIKPVFRLRDNIVRWVNDHLTIRAVQDAVAAVSTAVDRLVYMVIGIFLRPVLTEISDALAKQEQTLLAQDREVRAAQGEKSIFERGSTVSDPTHSQLAKDHYDHELNEIAGRIATVVTTYTIEKIATAWQPSLQRGYIPAESQDPAHLIDDILSALHHPCNTTAKTRTPIQKRMYDEVLTYCADRANSDPTAFDAKLVRLDREHVAERSGDSASHTHQRTSLSSPNVPENGPEGGDPPPYLDPTLISRISINLDQASTNNSLPSLSVSALKIIKASLALEPSADAPNPLDVALSNLGGTGLMVALAGVSNDEIAAMPGIGELLRDAVLMMRALEEERKENEGGVECKMDDGSAEGEWTRERCRKMVSLLNLPQRAKANSEEEWQESKLQKLKGTFEKLKVRN